MEIMIVVAIIGLLACMAIPNFVKARGTAMTNTCINNMRILDSAVDEYGLEAHLAHGTQVQMDNLTPYLKGQEAPLCPVGDASYTLGKYGDKYPISCTSTEAAVHNAAYQNAGHATNSSN